MSFYQDKQIRRYCFFLTAFITFTAIIGILFSEIQTLDIKKMYLTHDKAVASYLLEQGVPREVIAGALDSTAVNEEGINLLNMIGLNKETQNSCLPFISRFHKRSIIIVITAVLFLAVILFLFTFVFFEGRKRLYIHADHVIAGYINGDFSGHLPQNREGALDQLFTHIEQLATALQSQNESEHKTKEFLKRTISDISHQLKTPLAALTMYQEIIADEPDQVSTVKDYSIKMGISLKRMEQLIQAMLKIIRLDAGNIIFEKHHYRVAEVVLQSVNELSMRAEREGKEIRMDGEPLEQVFCDIDWTSEAIGNIVKNALDHTKAGDTIYIMWEKAPTMLRIMISDRGDGIASEDIHHIFKRFYRSKYSKISADEHHREIYAQGIGLGLPLAKSIIEGQGGLISAQSELNEGTTFTLSFLT